nr:hypothetical protein Iba_chr02dCG15620 [Ipomoea batatas]
MTTTIIQKMVPTYYLLCGPVLDHRLRCRQIHHLPHPKVSRMVLVEAGLLFLHTNIFTCLEFHTILPTLQ